MRHDQRAGPGKTAKLSRAAVTGKVLSQYEVTSGDAHNLVDLQL